MTFTDLSQRPAWWVRGACVGVTNERIFFPQRGDKVSPAKKICATCTVRVECLEYALDHHEKFGIWGGLSERQRRKLRRERNRK